VTSASAAAVVPYPALAAAFSNIGISQDASAAGGDLDGGGNSYSAAALAAAGLAKGATVRTPDGLEYTWPDVAPGQPDNVLGSGQTVLVDGKPGAAVLGLLTANTGGGSYGTVIAHYADGSSDIRLVYLGDWGSGPNASGPGQGFTAVATLAYRNNAGGKQDTTTYVYAATASLDPRKRVVAVTLPNRSGTLNAVVNVAHFFAVTTGTPAEYPSLAAAFSNTGISEDSAVTTANFDGAGYSYSAQALGAAGLTPGGTIAHDGLSFTWPDVPAGQPDNVLAMGQTIAVTGTGSRLGFLGASSPGTVIGTGVVHYADGTASEFSFRLDDYWYAPGTENDAVATLPYVNTVNVASGRSDHAVRVFCACVPIVPGRQVRAVTLPRNGANPPVGRTQGMHIFALAIG
jgi:hypothetical protein